MSKVHFVGGEKGGVGKSVVARLLAQFCIDKGMPFSALDADGSHGTLVRYYGDYARAIDLGRFESADEILTLATDAERRVVVDLPAQSHRLLSAWMKESGALEMAAESGVKIVFWHVIDDGKDSINTLDRLFTQFGGSVQYCVVKNAGRGQDFSLFEASAARATARKLSVPVLELPALHAAAMQKIDRLDASFWAAIHNREFAADTLTRMDRQRINVWLTGWYAQLAALDLI
ncbi:MAG TPA: mobilization protein [Polyangia bacterium]|jgi:hypothetical protein